MKLYDNYEISACRRFDRKGRPNRNGRYYEVCEADDADVWTLYGHITGLGAEAIGDFTTREHAEEVFQRITGIPFADTHTVAARLCMMHAAPMLLDSLRAASEWIDAQHFLRRTDIQKTIRQAIAKATGRAA
jgi:hypothetical protein